MLRSPHVAEAWRPQVVDAIRDCGGNVRAASFQLGVSHVWVYWVIQFCDLWAVLDDARACAHGREPWREAERAALARRDRGAA